MVLQNFARELGKSVGGFRSLGSQVLGAMGPNLSFMALQMGLAFPTIIIPDLINSNKALSLNVVEASWFGSIVFMVQPMGAFLSVPMLDYCGRKKSNYLSNIPHIIGWTLMYFAWNLPSLYFANALLGLGVGLLATPATTFLGELSTSYLRGSLIMLNQVFAGSGILTVFGLGTVVNWQYAAILSIIVPLLSIIIAVLVPDSPIWLLSQGKYKQALKALRFLRGWTTEENVREEFNELVRYTKALKPCILCSSASISSEECEHIGLNYVTKNIMKFKYLLLHKQTLRPLIFVIIYFGFFVMNGLSSMMPNLVNVCGALGMPGDPKKNVLFFGIIMFLTSIIQTVVIKFLGKRKTSVIGAVGCGLCCTGLSVYAKLNLEESVFSFDPATFPKQTNYIPLALLYLLCIFFGMYIPFVIMGEVFCFRSRALAQCVVVIMVYIMQFVGAKTFLDIEINFCLWGAFAIYAGFNFIGTIYLYLFTPETEGKSLEEIEAYYSGDFRIFADDPFINCFRKFMANSKIVINPDFSTTKL